MQWFQQLLLSFTVYDAYLPNNMTLFTYSKILRTVYKNRLLNKCIPLFTGQESYLGKQMPFSEVQNADYFHLT